MLRCTPHSSGAARPLGGGPPAPPGNPEGLQQQQLSLNRFVCFPLPPPHLHQQQLMLKFKSAVDTIFMFFLHTQKQAAGGQKKKKEGKASTLFTTQLLR